MRCGALHLRIQYILETSVRFDGDTNNVNLQTVLANRNTQRREEQVILSTIRCQTTESVPQASNYQTKKNDNMLSRQSGMDYSQGIQFETSIINMEEAQELTINNQP